MTIAIRQSTLNALGMTQDFPNLRWRERRDVTTAVLLATGRKQDAFLLEINNPVAVRSITYVLDETPLAAGSRVR
jgi:hypothetical protein